MVVLDQIRVSGRVQAVLMVPQPLGLQVVLVPVVDQEVKRRPVQVIQLRTLDLKMGVVDEVPVAVHLRHRMVRLVSEGPVVL